MENPFEDFDFGEIIEGDVEIAGRKIPKIALIGGAGVIILLLVLMGRKSGGSTSSSFLGKSTNQPSDDGTGAIEGSSSDVLAGVQQQIADSESKTATDFATQLTDTQKALEDSFNSQLSDIFSQLGSYNPVTYESSSLPVDQGFYGQSQYEPSYYDYAGVGGYTPPSFENYGTSQSPTIGGKNVAKSVTNVNKTMTSAPSVVSPTVKPSLGVVTNFGTIGKNLLSNQINKVLNKPQPIKPSATVPTKPGQSILSGALTSFISKPTTQAKPVNAKANAGVSSVPFIGNIASLGYKPSAPTYKPQPIATPKPTVNITKPPPVYAPKPPPKPAGIAGGLLSSGAKPKPKTNPLMKPNI